MFAKRKFRGLEFALIVAVATSLGMGSATAAQKPRAKGGSAVAQVAYKPAAKSSKRVLRAKASRRAVVVVPARPSVGHLSGLHAADDPLALKSSVALVLDQDTDEVLFAKNTQAVLPIASITKLMTAIVVTEAGLPLNEMLGIGSEDIDTEKGSGSRLAVGTVLSREDLLHLALMASENRAASALGRHYPGGREAFIAAMNRKAVALGMRDTRFVEPTGLSSDNRSSAPDLVRLVREADKHEMIRRLSTTPEMGIDVGSRVLQFRNTNSLVRQGEWEIGLQKTGYISEAGRCLVMQAKLAGRKLIMVFLDSAGRYSRIGDAERVRRWLSENVPAPAVAPAAELPSAATTAARPLS